MSVLVVVAHPDLETSVINRALAATAASVAGVEVVDIQAEYPDFAVDVEAEHERLRRHDRIVLQHPVYWYSSPPILKHWLDAVLQPGFAYAGGRELRDKQLCSAVSCGAPSAAYAADGWNLYRVEEFLAPFHATANFCRMQYLAPFVLYDTATAADGLDDELERYDAWLRGPGVPFGHAR